MEKYLVLGSNSFAGSCFVDHILSQGHEAIGISRSAEPHVVMLAYARNENINAFQFHQLDLNHDFDAITKIITEQKPNVVVDFAGQGMVAESWVTPEQWYQTNIVSKVKLHNLLKDCDFLDRYIRVSTPEVYGHVDGAISEGQAFNPTTPYAVSHAAIDMSLMTFHKQHGFPVIFTRFANFYGDHQQLYRIIPRTILYCLLGKKLQLHGGGTSKRAFIYGSDVAHALDLAVHHGKPGESYHFSASECVSIATVVKTICSAMNVDYDNFVEVVADRPGKDNQYFMSTKKAERELGWQPNTSLEQGIQASVNWVRDNLEIIKNLSLNYIHKP